MDFAGHPYSDPLEIALRRELQTGEEVLWKARPLNRIRASGFALYVFAVPWTAFALFWTAMAFAGVSGSDSTDAGVLRFAFPLFGLPFILVGLGMMSAPFLPLLEAGKVLYAVTNRRLIKLRLGRRLVTTSVRASKLGSIKRSEGRDGVGSLKIATGASKDGDGDRQVDYFEIDAVPRVMDAESSIREMLRAFESLSVSS